MGYKHDMSGEKEGRVMLPEGRRDFRIVGCKEDVSKSSGNPMFVFVLQDRETAQEVTIYAVSEKGKRWFLKQILAACGITAGEGDIYEWDIPDVLDKIISGEVVHFQDKWINRDNQEVTTKKMKIVDIDLAVKEQF